MIRGKSSKMGLSEMAGIAFVSEGANQSGGLERNHGSDLVAKTEPTPGGRSTFLAKREC
jgi:hypothetical protein